MILIVSFEELLASLPKEEQQQIDIRELSSAYKWEVSQLESFDGTNVRAILRPFEQRGSQYVADFEANDLSVTVKNEYNWHGQNTSQWLYAGCILVQDGRVSRHH